MNDALAAATAMLVLAATALLAGSQVDDLLASVEASTLDTTAVSAFHVAERRALETSTSVEDQLIHAAGLTETSTVWVDVDPEAGTLEVTRGWWACRRLRVVEETNRYGVSRPGYVIEDCPVPDEELLEQPYVSDLG